MSVMSNTVKTKFAGMLRGLLRRLDDSESPAPATQRVVSSPMHPGATYPVGTAPVAAAVTHSAPRPAPLPASAALPPAGANNPDELQLPLQPILAALTMDLRAKIMQTPPSDAMISVPLEKILNQLAFGSVKINFGELRHAAPGVFVISGGEHDHKPVTLPLNEILTRLNPARFSRRTAQKHLEVAEDITGPFGLDGQGVKISVPTKPTPSTTLTQRTSPESLRMVPPVAPAPAQSTPVTPPTTFVPRVVTPTAKVTPPLRPGPAHDTALVANLAVPRSNGAPKPVVPPPVPAASAPPLAAQIPVEAAAISAPLAALSEHWPEGLRLEIIQSDLAHAQVLLPVNLIEPALKRGRITLTWRNLRSLIRPAPPAVSVHDGIELELPLNVIAPLFFARQKTAARPQSVTAPPTDIPNLFFGFPQPEASPQAPAPAPPPVQLPPEPPLFRQTPPPQAIQPPVTAPLPRPATKPVDAKITDSNYYIWGDESEAPRIDETEYKHSQRPATDFTSRCATPKEIVERAMALPGVVGAVVALPDGLRVASQVPAELNADTLAAFLPQIFDRVSQSTRELRMGALNNFNFTVGNVPWRIFRVNAVYFAAFGTAGEALPSAPLAALAAELDRKKQ